MKLTAIKVIKRKALGEIARVLPRERLEAQPATLTTTVNDWISDFRKQKVKNDNYSRETIAGWEAGSST